MLRSRIPSLIVLLICVFVTNAVAQDEGGRRGRRGGDRSGDDKEKKKDGIKPYDKVVTKEAKTDTGLFIVHRIDDKLLYEIPRGALAQDFLWVTQISKTQSGFGYAGTPVRNSRVASGMSARSNARR